MYATRRSIATKPCLSLNLTRFSLSVILGRCCVSLQCSTARAPAGRVSLEGLRPYAESLRSNRYPFLRGDNVGQSRAKFRGSEMPCATGKKCLSRNLTRFFKHGELGRCFVVLCENPKQSGVLRCAHRRATETKPAEREGLRPLRGIASLKPLSPFARG